MTQAPADLGKKCEVFAAEAARVSRERGSWRGRLEWVRDVIMRDGGARDWEVLAYLGVFLKLVASGEIACAEDGGHNRPNRHAELGLQIEGALLTQSLPEQRPFVRGILRWLPSHDAPFRRAEPLTRIRDIAHRNDIPRALKDEIKQTLQNKLHRCAGPEDLKTSAELLTRITAEGASYPQAFVSEFRRFHSELEDFFNAGSVEQDLRGLLPRLPAAGASAIRRLLGVHHLGLDSPAQVDGELAAITPVRHALAPAFTPTFAAVDGDAQKMRLADLKLEERAFVLLAQRVNRLESKMDPPDLVSILGVMAEGCEQLALSGVEAELTQVLAAAHPRETPATSQEDDLLRARAHLETARTVLDRHADRVLGCCARFAGELGRLLALTPYMTEQFAEREIRGGLSFQLSRLVDFGLAYTARALGLPPWQAVVPGRAEGRLVSVDRLCEGVDHEGRPVLALVNHLAGDEELPPAIRALLVRHDLPYLSHVAIRARQSGVVMAARRDSAALEDALTERLGSSTMVTVDSLGLHVQASGSGKVEGSPQRFAVADTSCVDRPLVLALDRAQMASSGGKSWGARRLAEIAKRGAVGFLAPPGFVIPFGVMEACLAQDPQVHGRLDPLLDTAAVSSQALRSLIEGVALPEAFANELARLGQQTAGPGLLVARSSSNAEDLPGVAGAGLFDSVIGVRAAELGPAVRRVWGSLFGKRPLMACRAAGVFPRDLRMSVLVQPLVPADLSFVMFTQSPLDPSKQAVYVELAVGLGETLCSASGQGSPYRVSIDRRTRTHRLAAHLSYPDALVLGPSGDLQRVAITRSQLRFGWDPTWRQRLAERLVAVALVLERELGGPQDVEGAVVGDELWVLQSRPVAGAES